MKEIIIGYREETILVRQKNSVVLVSCLYVPYFHVLLVIHNEIFQDKFPTCSARDWDGKDYLRIIPRVVLVEDPRLT